MTLDDYRRHAIAYGVAIAEGNSDASNEAYGRVQRAFLELIKEGKGSELFNLYNDTDLSVQCWAAAHTLEIDSTRALEKLRQLEELAIPHISTDAEYTIKEWRSGELRFLP